LILFFAYDLCYYWAHRMSHEINLFWAGHVVHHQSEEYNLSVALRQSWFQSIFTAPFYLPLALLGFDTYLLIWVGAINLTYQFWIHTELIDKMGWLEWFMNTPSHHRVHHGRNPKYIDKNHAGVFIIWDRMFGTFQPEEERPTYGITTPLNSWNPVWANFSHFQTIYQQIKQTPSLGNQLRVLFNKPGWRPTEQGGPIPVPEVSRDNYDKFDTYLPKNLAWYALFQYLIITALALFYFLGEANWAISMRITGGAIIIWAVFQNSALFSPKPLVFWLDALWLAVAALFVAYQIQSSPWFWQVSVAMAGIYLLAAIWRFQLRQVFFSSKSRPQKEASVSH